MLIFIDETGDLGFDFAKPATSKLFVITALVIDDHRDRQLLEIAVSRTLRKKMRGRMNELKGHRMTISQKQYFWERVKNVPFKIYTVVVSKDRIYPELQQDKSRLYNYLARFLVDHIPFIQGRISLHIEIDKSKNAKEQRAFNSYIENHLKAKFSPTLPLSIFHMSSHESRGIQATDVFSSGVCHYYLKHDETWYKIFKDKIAFETLIYLPRLPRR